MLNRMNQQVLLVTCGPRAGRRKICVSYRNRCVMHSPWEEDMVIMLPASHAVSGLRTSLRGSNTYSSACHGMQDRNLAREGLWAHETEVPEVGGLLLARAEAPNLNSDSRLCQLVVFVLEHGPNGSKGVIINRPAAASVGDLLEWGYRPAQVRICNAPPLFLMPSFYSTRCSDQFFFQ